MRKRSRQYLLNIKANKPILIKSVDQLKIDTMYKFRYAGNDLVNMMFKGFISDNLLFVSFDTLTNLEILPPVGYTDRTYKIHMYEQKEVIKL
jgi:hypothetical protein